MKNKKPLIIAHRGDKKRYKDNTIKAIESAFKRGADGVEVDVHYTQKKGVYLVHDYFHDKNKKYPTLEKVIKKFSNKGKIQIEIKTPTYNTVKAVKKIINKYKPANFEITTSIIALLPYIKKEFPKEKVGIIGNYLVQDWWTDKFSTKFLLEYLKLTEVSGIHIGTPKDFWSKKKVEIFQQKGYRVYSHLKTDSKKDFQRVINLNIDGCTVDNLDVLKWRE